jgi:peptidoglycan/LPS O-acetylase OafA/YrhL
VSKIGYCSYSIYIIHSFVNAFADKMQATYHLYHNNFLHFFLTSAISIFAGLLMTHSIEKYFLKIRDKYYPNRAV